MEQMPKELGELALQYKSSEDKMYQEITPTAISIFSVKPLNQLVAAFNSVAPLFGLAEEYPMFEGNMKQLPVDFVKQLSMVKKAVDDAVESGIVKDMMSFSLTEIDSDNAVRMLAAKIQKLSADKAFKKWLAEEAMIPESEGASMEVPPQPEEDDELMSMLAQRM